MSENDIILKNLGGSIARNVQIPQVAGATFGNVDMIPSNQTQEVLPLTDRALIFGVNNIFPALDKLWEDGGGHADEGSISVDFTISYQDFERHNFEVDIELTYFSIKNKIRQSAIQKHGVSYTTNEIVKIRHLNHRRIS